MPGPAVESLRRVIVVGHELAVIGITRQLSASGTTAWRWSARACRRTTTATSGLPVYGTFDDVADAVEAAGADTVVVLSCPELDGVVLRRLAWRLERDEVDLIVASALIDVAGPGPPSGRSTGCRCCTSSTRGCTVARGWSRTLVDRVGALLLLLVLSPVLLGVALSRPGSRRAARYSFGRCGWAVTGASSGSSSSAACTSTPRRGWPELRHLNEHDGVLFKIRDDPRVTPVGRWLRRLSLDELPQLLNVMAGQMSLVGPRPPLPVEVAAYADDVRRRLAVKPGMTGLWQVSGRSDLSWEEAVRLDLRYVENWSLSLDLVILLRTMTAVVRSSGAY